MADLAWNPAEVRRTHAYDDRIIGGFEPAEWPMPREEAQSEVEGPLAWLTYIGMRATNKLVYFLPSVFERAATGAFARVAYRIQRVRNERARVFLRAAFPDAKPEEIEARVRGTWKHIASLSIRSEGTGRLVGRPLGENFALHLHPDVDRVLASDTGMVLVTCHVGNWEVTGAPIGALVRRPLYGVFRPAKNGPLTRWMQRTRESFGARMLGRYGAMKSIPTVLKAGGGVALLLDQRARKKPVLAPFFGRPAKCDRTVGVLVRRLKVPIVVFANYAEPEPGRFKLVIPKVFWPDELAGISHEEIATRINRVIEDLIRARPDQYFWIHDRYRKTPLDATEGDSKPSSADKVSNPLRNEA